MTNWTLADLLKHQAKMRKQGTPPWPAPVKVPATKAKLMPKASKPKRMFQLAMRQYPEFKPEVRFHPARKWRFDYADTERRIAVEYEGVMQGTSRHTTIGGYCGDVEKYNAAAFLGWRVFRVTAKTEDLWGLLEEIRGLK